jgi:hypothetical protein
MKKYVTLLLFLFVSCNNPKNDLQFENIQNESDSVLMKSHEDIQFADTIQKKSDSITKDKVLKIVTEIKYLNKEVEKFRTEKLTLENKLKVVSEKVIYRIDTVFIETQKNFWGKKKTVTTVNSDSSIVENLDSSKISVEKIDTLNNNQRIF